MEGCVLASASIALIVASRIFPDSGLAIVIDRAAAELSKRLPEKLGFRHLIYIVVLVIFLQALLLAAPLDLVIAWDISVYIEVITVVWTVSATAKIRGLALFLRMIASGATKRLRFST
uniref:hypothetical protein n=1 Tax=Sphingomonas bacterium TaxID=1895847 RepID=UPI00260DBF31|nr:hypothetical protein [Sphingomonas bacterium]